MQNLLYKMLFAERTGIWGSCPRPGKGRNEKESQTRNDKEANG